MIYYIIFVLIVIAIGFKFFGNFNPKDLNTYKFLFRNDIFTKVKNGNQTNETTSKLVVLMHGKAYRPSYIYFPEREQYLVYSSLMPFGFRRYDAYAPPHIKEVVSHVLLDKKGEIIQQLESDFNFSVNTGMFFTKDFYINWLASGNTTKLPYTGIYNGDIKMDKKQFANKFRELYAKADYIEYVNLRMQYDDEIGAGVVFIINNEWHILLDAVRNSHLYGKLTENDKTGVDKMTYSVSFDYYDPDSKRVNPYPSSVPLIKNVYLDTSDANPYYFNSLKNHDGLKLMKYQKLSATGWQGVATIKGIPIYVPGTGEGIAYMEYKMGKEAIRFKIPDVTKYDFRTVYNLGVRVFKMPKQLEVDKPLVFMESMQNFAHYNRVGGGIFVIKPSTVAASTISSLPNGITEETYAKLPLSLQVALMDIENTTDLKIKEWYPEIKELVNLKYLKITRSLERFPERISVLKKLEVLDLDGCGLESISPEIMELKQLKILNLYANRLIHFPEEICRLKELTHLYIGGNEISNIPNCISDLTKLRVLNLLNMDTILLPETMINMKLLRIERAEELKKTLPDNFHFLFGI